MNFWCTLMKWNLGLGKVWFCLGQDLQGLQESSYEFATEEVSKRRQIGPAALGAWTNVLQVAWTVNSYLVRPSLKL